MADTLDLDATFGKKQTAQQASPSSQPSSDQPSGMLDLNATFGKSDKTKSSSDDDAYEAKVQSLLPKARQYVEEQGPVTGGMSGAFLEGVGKPAEWLGLRTATRAGMAALGQGEGKNFSERYNQLKAEDEAVSRAFEEKHPVAKTAGEFASVAAYLPAGVVSAPVEAAAVARGYGPMAAKLAGMGAEGAAFGAGTAAAEQAFGTQSKQNEPGIVSSALIGGGLGAGLGAAGKGISSAAEALTPEFVKNLIGGEKRVAQKVAGMIDESKLADWAQAKDEGKPVSLYHLVNPENHEELTKILEGNPKAAKILQSRLATWASDAATNLNDFSNNLFNTKTTISDMEGTANALAKQRVQQAYDDARRRGNGAGSWDESWNKWLNSEPFTNALEKTIETMRQTTGLRTGDPNDYVSPFEKILESTTEIQNIQNLKTNANKYFKLSPSETVTGAETAPGSRYQLIHPEAVDIDFLDTLQRFLNKSGSSKLEIANTPEGALGSEIMKARGTIMDSLTNPKSKFYNKDYADALVANDNIEKTEKAFDLGRKIWQNITNAKGASQIANDIADMSPREKFYVAHGLMSETLARVTRPDGSVNVGMLNNLLKEGPARQAVENAMGARRFGELERHIRIQGMMTNAIKSAENYGAGKSMDYDAIRTVRTLGAYVVHNAAALSALAYNWAEQAVNAKYAKRIATQLASDDIETFKKGLAAIEENDKNKFSFGNWFVQNAPRYIGSMAGGHADGGAVQGYAFGGAPNERRIANKSVTLPKPGDPNFVGPTMTSSSYDPNKSHVFDKLNVLHRDNPIWTPNLGNASARGYAVDKSGRSIMRSTGGRIPEADKLFKQAKKYVDSHTKNLLNVPDDDIVKALRVAAKRV
jgi:hypothetical protein